MRKDTHKGRRRRCLQGDLISHWRHEGTTKNKKKATSEKKTMSEKKTRNVSDEKKLCLCNIVVCGARVLPWVATPSSPRYVFVI